MSRKGTTKANGQKHDLDKFYTKPSIAAQCLARLDLAAFDRIIEPSAGGGAFSDHLFAAGDLNVLAFDLAPENDAVTRQDWFEYRQEAEGSTLVVGNPPFGQQCNLAVRFINHAFEAVGADAVAFVLPRSFRKDSVKNRVFRHAELVDEVLLAPNSFTLEGADYNLPAVFQVWRRCAEERPVALSSLTSTHFTFVKRAEDHDLAIRRVGGRAGFAFTNSAQASEQSNYFLKLTGSHDVATVVAMINALDFSVADDGTGPRTLSKRELVAILDAGFATLPVAA